MNGWKAGLWKIVFFVMILLGTSCRERIEHKRLELNVIPETTFRHVEDGDIKQRFDFYHFVPGEVFRIDYTWRTGEWNRMDRKLRVAVHLEDKTGNVIWQDDHYPRPGTLEWKAGRSYSYSRVVRIPGNIPEGTYNFKIGLYDPEPGAKRYSLAGSTGKKVTIAKFRVADLGKAVYREGWLDRDFKEPWRWAGKEAIIRIPNPGSGRFIHLKGVTNRGCFIEAPTLTVMLGETEIFKILFEGDEVDKWVRVPKRVFGHIDSVDMRFLMSATFIPSTCDVHSTDHRELGFGLFPLDITTIRFGEGFFPVEKKGLESWRWMGKEGHAEIINPRQPAILYLSAGTTFEKVRDLPEITVRINDRVQDKFRLSKDTGVRLINLDPEDMGSDDIFHLAILVDHTFSPGESDTRNLGLMVNSIELIVPDKTKM